MRRRDLLKGAAAGTGFWVLGGAASATRRSPNDTLDLAVVGVDGRGGSNLDGVGGENIVALCDLDKKKLAKGAKKRETISPSSFLVVIWIF